MGKERGRKENGEGRRVGEKGMVEMGGHREGEQGNRYFNNGLHYWVREKPGAMEIPRNSQG